MKPELRVFLRRACLINPPPPAAEPELPAFVGLLIPKVIEFALGGIGSLLKKAGEADTEQVTGSEIVNLFVADEQQRLSANPNVGCVLAVYGVFDNKHGKPTQASDAALKKLEAEKIVPENAGISIILEAAVVRTDDGTAFYLEARHF